MMPVDFAFPGSLPRAGGSGLEAWLSETRFVDALNSRW